MKTVFFTLALVAFVGAHQQRVLVPPEPRVNQQSVGYPERVTVTFPQKGLQPSTRKSSIPMNVLSIDHLEKVCDFDASVLVLDRAAEPHQSLSALFQTAQEAIHQQQLTKLKCADAAALDIRFCTQCCRFAALTIDDTARLDQIKGMLVELDDEEDQPDQHSSKGYRTERVKRHVESHRESPEAPRDNKNIKCMCCNPRPATLYPFSYQ
uniref:Secreted protein n=1 Tax=Steinernema glaseri TaxID=37863 RepID=A0A1I8ABK9_9BILA